MTLGAAKRRKTVARGKRSAASGHEGLSFLCALTMVINARESRAKI